MRTLWHRITQERSDVKTSIAALFATALVSLTISAHRVSQEPLLRPGTDGTSWTRFGLFNPAAIKKDGKTILLFRAQDAKHTSYIGYAESSDGVHFTVRRQPVLSPEAPYEKGGGIEDPRLIEIGGAYYLTYTGYDLHAAQLCLATSADLEHWQRLGVILPAYKGTWNEQWTKSGAIVPEKILGKWWMYYLGTKKDSDGKARDYMGLASSSDLLHWSDATAKPVLDRRPSAFDARVMEPGPPPFLTGAGILLLYNGADESLVYRPGWVLFDRNDPRRVLARSNEPFIQPALGWEKVGNVPNVIFLEGAIPDRDTTSTDRFSLFGYYGAADKFIGGMKIQVSLGNQ
ncbi:MAG: family 43 glycosylhydrolase [Acidobacteriaceae bacterium]|nr:family 43 glycosylhydrolase [Acidobacteriaceae bacterium]